MTDPNVNQLEEESEAMRPEYDFAGGVRGKHHAACQHGYRVVIHGEDGSEVIRDYPASARTVLLDPDVHAYFPNSEAVNEALRGLIRLIPSSRRNSGDAATPTSTPSKT